MPDNVAREAWTILTSDQQQSRMGADLAAARACVGSQDSRRRASLAIDGIVAEARARRRPCGGPNHTTAPGRVPEGAGRREGR